MCPSKQAPVWISHVLCLRATLSINGRRVTYVNKPQRVSPSGHREQAGTSPQWDPHSESG